MIHLEILDKKRQEVFSQLYSIFKDDFYLAGGTALALQIKHRESYDFDLFFNKEISFSLKKKAIKAFGKYSIQMLVDTSDELTLVLNNEIKLSLVAYWWDPIFPLIRLPKMVPLLSIKDIAATKAYALGRRGNYRDYFDLYVIIKNNYASINEIVKWSQRKYGEVFSERMFLEQLSFAGDIKSDKNLRYVNEKYISPLKLSQFFKKEIQKRAI